MLTDASRPRDFVRILDDILLHSDAFCRAAEAPLTVGRLNESLGWEAFRLSALFQELSRAGQTKAPAVVHRWIDQSFGLLERTIDRLLERWQVAVPSRA